MTERRVVLVPHGLPAHHESRERCCELILRSGGDLSRLLEGSAKHPERFAEHVAGIADIVNGRELPLVVLTELEPLEQRVVKIRALLEGAIAVLEQAPWLLYADPFASDTCLESLKSAGKLDGQALNAPLWTGPDGLRYLVLSPLMRNHVARALLERVHLAEFGCGKQSSTRSLTEASPSLRVTAPPNTSVFERPTIPVRKRKAY